MYKVVGDIIVNHRGDVMAQRVNGVWDTKDPAVLECLKEVAKPVAKPVVKDVEVELVRATDEEGNLISDDPSTPEVNEAWVARVKKKVTKKK